MNKEDFTYPSAYEGKVVKEIMNVKIRETPSWFKMRTKDVYIFSIYEDENIHYASTIEEAEIFIYSYFLQRIENLEQRLNQLIKLNIRLTQANQEIEYFKKQISKLNQNEQKSNS